MNNSGFRGAPLPAPAWPQPQVSSWTLRGSRSRVWRMPRGIPGWESAAGNKNTLSFPGGVSVQVRAGRGRAGADAARAPAQCGAGRGGAGPVGVVTAPALLDTFFQQRDPSGHARGELRRGNSLVAEGPRGVAMGTPRPAGRPHGFVGPRAPEGREAPALTSAFPRFCLSPWPGRRARGPRSSP